MYRLDDIFTCDLCSRPYEFKDGLFVRHQFDFILKPSDFSIRICSHCIQERSISGIFKYIESQIGLMLFHAEFWVGGRKANIKWKQTKIYGL